MHTLKGGVTLVYSDVVTLLNTNKNRVFHGWAARQAPP
jgi:hypothetical protein